MKIKTADLQGAALDWAVAKCEGITLNEGNTVTNDCDVFAPSIDWSLAGPIIERERIDVYGFDGDSWGAEDNFRARQYGPTPLIAAMRCYVASKLGDAVDAPEEVA